MKYLQLFTFILLLLSCATKPNTITDNTVIIKNNHCPDDGVCSLEIIPNQNLTHEKDGLGVLYPLIIEGNKTLLVFEYKRNEIPDTVDGVYRELIYLELNTDNIEVNFEETGLQKVKALFARLCFCRGQTGYYPIKQGTLLIKKLDKNEYSLKMNFKIDEVPHIVNSIETVFTLN